MSTDTGLFHFDDGKQSFEDLGQPNGATHWREADLMHSLGYQNKDGFRKIINKAKQACLSVNIGCEEHFALQPDGDHFITRFGCYLAAMNGDSRKPEVAAAQAYFATLADTFQSHLEHAEGFDRLLVREEVTDGQKSLSSTAKAHGVTNYAFFLNKGYLGMYNKSLERLCDYKGVPSGERLIDRMNKTELAAHLFRITQTDAKIKNENVRGQIPLEDAAFQVGRTVRDTVRHISGVDPEDMNIAPHLRDVKKGIKGTKKTLGLIDKRSET